MSITPPERPQQPQDWQPGPVTAYGDAIALQQTRQIAKKDLPTPVSFIGSAHLIGPLAEGSTGFVAVLRFSGVLLHVLLFWLVVTIPWYVLVVAVPFAWIFWLIFTIHRRRSIYDARAALAGRL